MLKTTCAETRLNVSAIVLAAARGLVQEGCTYEKKGWKAIATEPADRPHILAMADAMHAENQLFEQNFGQVQAGEDEDEEDEPEEPYPETDVCEGGVAPEVEWLPPVAPQAKAKAKAKAKPLAGPISRFLALRLAYGSATHQDLTEAMS